MSKALEETMKRLERTSISDMRNTGATSPSLASTLSAASPVHHSDMQASQSSKDGVLSPGSAHSASPVNGGYSNIPGALAFSSDQARIDSDALGKNRARRAVQSMYGAPPGYNASIGVGGSYNSLGRGRVSSGRQRNSVMVPDQLQAALTPQNVLPANQLQPPVTRLTGAEYALMANMPDDAIPNAIVVKNITFTIKREDLLQTMADLSLPMPYAFNYHFDNGVFRGLAFGNFRTPEEAARVIIGLNGVSLLGRPLKVEYKKTLPGTVPPPHPNTIAMMNSSNLNHQSVGDMQIQQQQQQQQQQDIFGGSSAMSFGQNQYQQQQHQQQYQQQHIQQQQYQFEQPIPRPRRNQNTDAPERPRSMMVLPSSMSMPDHLNQNYQQQQQQRQSYVAFDDDVSAMIDLDDAETRIIYDVVSQFRHNKSMTELEFPAVLSTKHRQLVMLIAERFGLNHETKTNEEGRCVRIYKGLATLLEGTEARRRSVASPSPAGLSNGSIGSHAGAQRYGATGRSRPSSMLYPDTMNMNGFNSPLASHQQQHQQQRMGSFQSSQQGYQNDLSRVRSYTHSQGVSAHFQQHPMQQQQQQQQQPVQQHQPIQQEIGLQQQQQQHAFPRASDAPGRASGNYGGYPSRLYQDSAVVPHRHPRGPEMSQNFVARQQMHQQDERQIQRQTQLKVLQQNRQRRLSSTAENNNDTPSTPAAVATAAAAAAAAASPAESLSSSTFKIEKPLSKAIPIVRPPGDSDSKYRSLSASPLIPNSAAEQTKQH